MEELEWGVVMFYNYVFIFLWSNFFGDDWLIFDCMLDVVYFLFNIFVDIFFEEMYLWIMGVEMIKVNFGFLLGYKCIIYVNFVFDFLIENDYWLFDNFMECDLANLDCIQGEM